VGAKYGAKIGRDERGSVTFALGGLSSTFSREYADLEHRIAYMDSVGVDMHVLSLMAPLVCWAPAAAAVELAQVYNEASAAACAKYPDRFAGMAVVPTHEPALAVEELERVKNHAGMCGVIIGTEINGKNLDEREFFPIYAKCEELGWPIFVHPINPLGGERMTRHYMRNLLGNPIEIGVAGYSLILGGVLDAFPKLEVMLPRAGGNVPWGIGRLERTVDRWPQFAKARKPATDYLRRFYFDTIVESAEILNALIGLAGADRLLFGTDYASVMRDERPVEFIGELATLSTAERDGILGGNAARAFRIG
jgi:aminocarboxymuconate-semialdehyde decarboxylase